MADEESSVPQSVEAVAGSATEEGAAEVAIDAVEAAAREEETDGPTDTARSSSRVPGRAIEIRQRMRELTRDRFRLVRDEEVERLPPPEPLAGPLIANSLA